MKFDGLEFREESSQLSASFPTTQFRRIDSRLTRQRERNVFRNSAEFPRSAAGFRFRSRSVLAGPFFQGQRLEALRRA